MLLVLGGFRLALLLLPAFTLPPALPLGLAVLLPFSVTAALLLLFLLGTLLAAV
jgi:hypothetical protein